MNKKNTNKKLDELIKKPVHEITEQDYNKLMHELLKNNNRDEKYWKVSVVWGERMLLLASKKHKILSDEELDTLIKEKVRDPKDWEMAKALLSLKPSEKMPTTTMTKEQFERFKKKVIKFAKADSDKKQRKRKR
jgi:hypothetical protein